MLSLSKHAPRSSSATTPCSMRPGDLPVETEIVRIRFGPHFGNMRLEHLTGNLMLLGVRHGFFTGIKLEPDLAAHIGRARPAHQRFDRARHFRLELQHPAL